MEQKKPTEKFLSTVNTQAGVIECALMLPGREERREMKYVWIEEPGLLVLDKTKLEGRRMFWKYPRGSVRDLCDEEIKGEGGTSTEGVVGI